MFPVQVPPLRERVEDVPLLVWRFVEEFSKASGKRIDAIDKDSLAALQHYSWPGNVRELRNVVERAMISASTKTPHHRAAACVGRGNQKRPTTARRRERAHSNRARRHGLADSRCMWRCRQTRAEADDARNPDGEAWTQASGPYLGSVSRSRNSRKLERLMQSGTLMVQLTVTLRASSQRDLQNLLEALRFLMSGTRLEPECRECSVWVDSDSTLHCVEEWRTEADMRRRVRSPRFTSLLGVIVFAHEEPRVQFDFVTITRGLEDVTQIRNNTPS